MLIRKDELNHYTWGENCDGWRLVDSNELSIIEECMPPGKEESFHYHKKATQLFYILNGEADFIIEGKNLHALKGESIRINPMQVHKVINKSADELRFLLVSQPKAQGDRFEITP